MVSVHQLPAPQSCRGLKKRGFIENKGKDIISTRAGKGLIAILPELVKSPVMTAINERMLLEIEQGKRDVDSFVKMQEKFVRIRLRLLTLELSKLPVVCKFLTSTNARCLIRAYSPSVQKSRSLLVLQRLSTCKRSYPDIKGSRTITPVKTRLIVGGI